MKNEIILFEDQNVKLEVNMKDETVWLTQSQMAVLFDKSVSTINEHIKNIFKSKELKKDSCMSKFGNSEFTYKPIYYYNLDVIISVGYRVNSKRGIIFRRWANQVLKDYLLKGYAVNQKRLDYFEKTIKLIDIANRVDTDDSKDLLRILSKYSKSFSLLDDYDNKSIDKPKGTNSKNIISYEECINIINNLKSTINSDLFALEKDDGLKNIINTIYQTYNGRDVYDSIQEKGANFLYMIVKDHIFIDGNKRVGATLFIYFLNFYNILFKNNKEVIDNNALTALTLLIAESNPKEKSIMIDLIMNFIIN